jgi:hypothetical protein
MLDSIFDLIEGNHLPMNSLVEHQFPVLEQTLALRHHLLDNLTDADLAFGLPGNPTLGELCRESGQYDPIYIESFKTFAMDWTKPPAPTGAESSVAALRDWYTRSDEALKAAIRALSEEDVQGKMIDRQEGGFIVPAGVQFHIYREGLLIFCAKVSVYLRALAKSHPEQWETWIG